MDSSDELAAVALANGGYLLTRHLNELGYGRNRITALLKQRILVKIRYGAYAPKKSWDVLRPVEQHAAIARSVLERCDDGAVASHQTAAALLGLDLWDADLGSVHLTRLDGRSGRHQAGVVWHEPLIGPEDVVTVDGVPCTSPVRAALETASITGVEQGVVTLSAALRTSGMSEEEVQRQVGRFRSWAGADTVRAVAGLADARLESAGEARSYVMFHRHRVDLPELQVVIVDLDGRAVGRVDFAWTLDRHVGEFDGLIKYGRLNAYPDDPGRAIVEEKIREDLVRDTRNGMSRWGWVDLRWERQRTTCARIQEARARSRRLYVMTS